MALSSSSFMMRAAASRLAAATSRGSICCSRHVLLLKQPNPLIISSPFVKRWFSSSYPEHVVIGMPSLSPTMESGSISKWELKEGDTFAAGEVLCQVETDKATVDFEAQDDGVVAKILAEAGPADIPCGDPILITVDDVEDVPAFVDYVVDASSSAPPPAAAPPPPPEPAEATPPPTPTEPTTPAPPPTPAPTPATSSGEKVIASPLAHMLAKDMGYDIASIPGTGPGGRVIAADVKEFVPSSADVAAAAAAATMAVGTTPTATTAAAATTAAPAQAAMAAPTAPPVIGVGYTDYPLSPSAQETAAALTHSKQNVPHYYLTVDISMDALLEMRATLNESLLGGGGGSGEGTTSTIGTYELLLKAAAAAMKVVPSANASWMDSVVRVYDSVDINVVVGNGDALYTPVIRDVGGRGVSSLSQDLETLVSIAASRSADDDEEQQQGLVDTDDRFASMGTFTVMNLGMYGIKSCAPIIREPQACALALGAMENRIVPNDNEDSEDIYKQSVMLTATLSCDHRVVDGAVGAEWLSAFKTHVESPSTLLL